jgi:2-dehydropantoate 2-reductase
VADPILIWGAGAIGGTLGAYWTRAGIDVLMVDIVPEHVAACRSTGLNIEGPVEVFTETVPAVLPDEVEGLFSRVVLAVKAQHTAAAVTALEPHLAANGFVLSAQNGLNELEIARQVGEDRTMGAFVNFGADWLSPGRILLGNRGAVVIGEIAGPEQERTRNMYDLLRIFEPNAVLTDNIWGFLWGKLAYGAMLFATATNMDSMADNFADLKRFPVWRKLGAEVMDAAAARGIAPVGFDGFDPASFASSSSDASARQSVADLAAFNRGSAKTHSGVWRDLAVRKRRTEIDNQIGVIATLSAEVDLATPAIDRLVELVHDIEAGRRIQSSETFNELLAICP